VSQPRPARPPHRISDIWKAPLHDFPIRDEILYQYLPLSAEMDVLEVGPGSGITAFRWASRVRSLTLLDVAQGNIAQLQLALSHIPNVRFICADIGKPELPQILSQRFDAAYAIEVFELVPDPEACLKNLGALLRPGAHLLLQFPNYPPPKNPGVTYFAERRDLDRLFRDAGFTTWSVYTLALRPHAQALYRTFHEGPLRVYRRLRARPASNRPLVYDQSWTFQQQHRLESFKPLINAVWLALSVAMGCGGECFTATPTGVDILNRNLLVLATR